MGKAKKKLFAKLAGKNKNFGGLTSAINNALKDKNKNFKSL